RRPSNQMAYSFWKSSHFEQWTMEKADLLRGRAEDLKTYSEEEYQKIIIFFCNMMQSIAQDTSSNNATKIRMQVVATSSLYFKRFYIRRSFKDVDPFLMAPTCLMLAAKVEEFGALSTNKMSNGVNTYVKKMGLLVDLSPLRVGSLLEAEFILIEIEILDCCLICFQPYRPLKQLFQDLREQSSQFKDLETLEASAVKIINDSIRTDLSIIYPPHVIAIGAFQLAVIMHNREKDFLNWFADLQVEMDKILDVVQTMTNLYKVWKTAEDKETMKALFDRMRKPNPNPPPQQQQQQQQLQ
ncbi:hypothetical protein PENTCL1PPCAC_475, partial [Pristionchus entomophagus]